MRKADADCMSSDRVMQTGARAFILSFMYVLKLKLMDRIAG